MNIIGGEKIIRLFLYQTLKIFLVFFLFFTLLNWFIDDQIDIFNNILFASLIAVGGITPIILTLKILTPEINKETAEKRIEVFKNCHMAIKLIGSLTLCLAFFLMLFRMLMNTGVTDLVFGLSFGEALAWCFGIGFLFAAICTFLIRFIIKREKPPFQNLSSE